MFKTGTLFFRFEELVPNFQICEESVPNPHTCENSVPNPQNCEKMVSNQHMWKIGIKSHTYNELVPNPPTCFKLVPTYHNCEELVQMLVTIHVTKTHVCCMKFDFVRIFYEVWGIGTKYVTYLHYFFTWCEELVPILHSVIFTKCESCGSTRLSILFNS